MASQLAEAAAFHIGNAVLHRSPDHRSPANRRLTRRYTICETAKAASLQEAIEYRNKNMIKEWLDDNILEYPIISTPLSTLGEFGVGIELYFVLLKHLGILFFIISIISAMPIYLNSQGGYYDEGDIKYFFDEWTIGNQEGLKSTETDMQEAEDLKDTIDMNHLMIILPDIAYTTIFIIFLIVYRFNSSSIVRKNLKYNVTAADYAVEVKGFPRAIVDPKEVKDHFSKFGEVVEVSLARRYNGLLRKYKTRAEYTYKLSVERTLATDGKTTKKMKYYENLIRKFDKEICEKENKSDKTHDELPVDRAYVIFNEVRHMKACLKAYSDANRCCRRRKFQPDHLKFQSKYPLKVIQAVEPDNILWENLEVGRFNRFWRMIFVVAITLIVMVGSIAIIYYLKSIESEIPTDEDCRLLDVDYNLSLDEAEDQLEDDQIFCYCKKKNYDDIVTDSDLLDFCEDFIEDYTSALGIRLAAAFGVIVVNFMLRIILRLLSQFERSSSINKEQRKTMIKVFVAIFINTAIITLIVNADFRDLEFTKDLAFRKYLFNGDYDDFDRTWYLKVGSTFVIMMFMSTLSPHIFFLILSYPINACKRRYGWKKYKTQHEINSVFLGPEFDRAGKTAQILSVVFICFLYSGGMPILNILCFCTMFILFWVDKILILRYYRRPPMLNYSINDRVIAILPYAIILHCAVSLYMYGSQYVFPTEFYLGNDNYIHPETESIEERIKRSSGIAMIGLMGLTVLVNFLNITITKVINRYRKAKLIKENRNQGDEQGSYIEEIYNIRDHGLETYNILKNLTYKPLIEALNSAAKQVKRLKNEDPSTGERLNPHADTSQISSRSLTGNSGRSIGGESHIEYVEVSDV